VNVGFMYGKIDLMSFFPGRLRVHPGDTVVWHMTTVPHTITFLNGNPEPSLLQPAPWPPTSGETVMFNPAILGPSATVVASRALNKTDMFHSGFIPAPGKTFTLKIGTIEGPIPYRCLLHDASGMVGKLVVVPGDEPD
jgi:plastocyanin